MRIFEHPPQVGNAVARRSLFFCDSGEGTGSAVVVDIANVGDFHVGDFEKIIHVCHAAAQSHHPDPQRVDGLVGGMNRVALGQASGGDSCGRLR